MLASTVCVSEYLDFEDPASFKNLGYDLSQLVASHRFSLPALLGLQYPVSVVQELRKGRVISARELRGAGYSLLDCARLGFDIDSLRATGFPEGDLLTSGLFSASQLKKAGCDPQRFVLVTFFQALDGQFWKIKTNWLSNRPLRDWHGVTVDNHGLIIKIDLRSNYLRGELPGTLSLLPSLQYLDLYNNRISGKIPDSYTSLQGLRDLWVTNTELTIERARLKAMLPHCKIRL